MSESATPNRPDGSSRPAPSPFLQPRRRQGSQEPLCGLPELQHWLADRVPQVTRGLVWFSMEVQRRTALQTGKAPNVAISVLNRRRRAARQWLEAIAAGQTDDATLHSLVKVWVPSLAGTGPDPQHAVDTGKRCLDYLHGAISGLIFDAPDNNLVPRAKALHCLETVLGVHLWALNDLVERAVVLPANAPASGAAGTSTAAPTGRVQPTR